MPEPTNNQRARWAYDAFAAFTLNYGQLDNREAMSDLLCDLLHLCDVFDLDGMEIIEGAKSVYQQEIAEQPKADCEALS